MSGFEKIVIRPVCLVRRGKLEALANPNAGMDLPGSAGSFNKLLTL
jgi:hypothetical protein